MAALDGVEIIGAQSAATERVLTPEALAFVVGLHREFNPTREALLKRREERQARLAAGETPLSPPRPNHTGGGGGRAAPAPADLLDRRVEITGPVERKMMINALNSGAKIFMSDLEDSLAPTWDNVVTGQANLRDAV